MRKNSTVIKKAPPVQPPAFAMEKEINRTFGAVKVQNMLFQFTGMLYTHPDVVAMDDKSRDEFCGQFFLMFYIIADRCKEYHEKQTTTRKNKTA